VCRISYTGIAEIDVVLLELYSEQVSLGEALRRKPKDKTLIERRRNITFLTSRLLEFGLIVQSAFDAIPENS